MSADENSWRTPQFRQSVVAKIDEALQRSGMATVKKGTEMENHVFQKAKTKEEYLGFVARLILHVRELNQKKAGGAMPGTCGVQDPINALQNLARQGSGNTMLGGLPPPPGPQQPNAPNPLMQGMNPRPVLQQKLTTGMQNKIFKTEKNHGFISTFECKKEPKDERDPILDEIDNVDVTTAVNMRKRTFSEMCREACGLLRAVNKKLDAKDEFLVFGEHVAMKLRGLKSEHAKNVAQFHINTILFEALTGKYDTVPSPHNSVQEQGSPPSTTNSFITPSTNVPLPNMSPPINTMSPQANMMTPQPNMKASSPSKNSPQLLEGPTPSTSSSDYDNNLSNIYNLAYDDFIH